MNFEVLTDEEVEIVLTDMTMLNKNLTKFSHCDLVNTKTNESIGYLVTAKNKLSNSNVAVANETLGKPFLFKKLKDCKRAIKLMKNLEKNHD